VSDRFFEHQTRHAPPVWVSLNRAVAFVIVIIVLSTLAIRYLPETSRRNEMMAQVQDLENNLAEKKAILLRHEREERLLRTSPEFLSLIARDKLDLMQEGETLFRIDLPKR